MNRFTLLLLSIAVCTLTAYAAKSEVTKTDSGVSFINVTTSNFGELESSIGDNWNQVDSLVINGPMDSDDFAIIRKCGVNGKLKVVNMEGVQLQDKKLPKYAFSKGQDLYNPTCKINKIMLPADVEEIGEGAFGCLTFKEFNLPSSIKVLGGAAFTYCHFDDIEEVVLPEGISELSSQCFYHAYNIKKLTLPSSLKAIADYAFCYSGVQEISFPEGLESIGEMAFLECRQIESIYLPNSVKSLGDDVFADTYKLRELHLPEELDIIPYRMAYCCIALEKIDMPLMTTYISEEAFMSCEKLTEINLPWNLEGIGTNAFRLCTALESLHFKSHFTTIETGALRDCSSLAKIYCENTFVPLCGHEINDNGSSNVSAGAQFFDGVNANIPVYVPVGTAIVYSSSYGWDYFSNFIELDSFPSDGVPEVISSQRLQDNTLYDLMGRRVLHPQNGSIYIQNGKKIVYREY